MRLYLASTSPARLATLRAAGIEPILLASNVDEDAAVAAAGTLTGPEMVLLLARLKAEAVVGGLVDGEPIDGLILGGDSAFELEGVIYGKPHDPAVARERWMRQRGRTGQLHSGHWLIDARRAPVPELDEGPATTSVSELDDGPATNSVPELDEGPATGTLPGIGDVSTATVQFMDDMTDDEIDAYIATGEPLEVAGAFTIDSLGAAFIREVHGDPHAVVGLSVSLLRILVRRFGIDWPQLWNLPL